MFKVTEFHAGAVRVIAPVDSVAKSKRQNHGDNAEPAQCAASNC
jgi:hypothetical protein